MTSINAIRFDKYSGAMICDEQRHWNDERIKVYAADKIRAIVPPYIRQKYGIAACYGNTGTSSIGDELRLTMYREVENKFNQSCRELNREPERFMSIYEIARFSWDLICRLKHQHVDQNLMAHYGFCTADFVQSSYQKDNRTHPIKNEMVVKDAMERIARDPDKLAADAVFGNAGIVAGFDQRSGFQLYNYSMRDGMMEPVECGYVALGSGGDTTNFVLPRFFNSTGVRGRLDGVDRVEALCAVIDAVNMASEHNLGVGGYFNIILFDMKGEGVNKSYCEINDHRSRLASETIRATRAGFVSQSACKKIIEGILFGGQDAVWGEKLLWKSTKDALNLHRLLRGYPVICRD